MKITEWAILIYVETKAICKCKVILRVKVKNLVNYCIDVSFTFH